MDYSKRTKTRSSPSYSSPGARSFWTACHSSTSRPTSFPNFISLTNKSACWLRCSPSPGPFRHCFFGALSDRIGRRPILIPAVFAFSILSWLSGIAHNFHQLLLIRALMGLAEGPCWSIMTALIEESSTPTRRGRNIGIVVSAGALVGLAVAPVLTTQVVARFGWRWAFFLAGVPGILMGLLMWKFVKSHIETTRRRANAAID